MSVIKGPSATMENGPPFLKNMFATMHLLAFLHDLQELFKSDAIIARDVPLFDNLIDIRLICEKK